MISPRVLPKRTATPVISTLFLYAMVSEAYDFVIAGGGTAGLVLATRLSELTNQKILVLEAGLDLSEDLRIKTPALYLGLFGSDADWDFHTKPQVRLCY